jgi:hypothetical protein
VRILPLSRKGHKKGIIVTKIYIYVEKPNFVCTTRFSRFVLALSTE